MTKHGLIAAILLSSALHLAPDGAVAAGGAEGDWVDYATAANGDVHFYDPSRLETTGTLRRVWTGIRYKTSVMGASSFRSLVEIDCSARTEKTLQSTFFTDDQWQRPAMKTNTSETPRREIAPGSMQDRLADIVCG